MGENFEIKITIGEDEINRAIRELIGKRIASTDMNSYIKREIRENIREILKESLDLPTIKALVQENAEEYLTSITQKRVDKLVNKSVEGFIKQEDVNTTIYAATKECLDKILDDEHKAEMFTLVDMVTTEIVRGKDVNPVIENLIDKKLDTDRANEYFRSRIDKKLDEAFFKDMDVKELLIEYLNQVSLLRNIKSPPFNVNR